jgi:predicted dehydrogenase
MGGMTINPYKIALVGGGQLGSRYLQGIVKSVLDVEIYIVDPSNDSLKICRDRILEVNPTYNISKINNLSSVEELPLSLDLLIVATTANIRWKVISDFFKFGRKVKYAILEKVLFQREVEYSQCESLLRENNVRAWVNCPRRLIPIYTKLKAVVAGKLNAVVVSGGSWGLASNSIHFIDIISFLSGHDDIDISSCNTVHPSKSISKRPGFYETYGSMAGLCGDVEFNFNSKYGQGNNHLIHLDTDDLSITIDEVAGKASFFKDGFVTEEKFEMPLQSDISGLLAESILLNGTCELTSYAVSAKLHLPFIRFINDTFTTQYNEEICQLT